MKVAVVMTVKNEERLLPQNVHYHLGIGIECIFIYFDGTTDHGKEKIRGIPKVIVQDSIQAEKYKDRDYLDRFTSNAQEHHTARQCLNTYDALQQSKAAGIDWLISLDADELFLTNNKGEQSLSEFFSKNKDHDVIQLSTMEVIGRKIEYRQVMVEETLFKVQKNFKSKLDQIYIKIYNPYTRKYMNSSYWFGHTMGKAAINVKREIIPHNVHRYKSVSGNKLNLKNSGNILHYHLYDFKDFLKKYDNFKSHPPTFLSGNKIETLKSLWIQLVNDPNYSKQYLKLYYEKFILFNSKVLKRLDRSRLYPFFKRKEISIIEIELPKKILKNF